jgi:hypothetical protein
MHRNINFNIPLATVPALNCLVVGTNGFVVVALNIVKDDSY